MVSDVKKEVAKLKKLWNTKIKKEVAALAKDVNSFMAAAKEYAELHPKTRTHKKIHQHHRMLKAHVARLRKVA